MRTIWKFDIQVDDTVTIFAPCTIVKWLHAEATLREGFTRHINLWAIVETEEGQADQAHTVLVRGTGHQHTGIEGYHIATVHDGIYVWHLFTPADVSEFQPRAFMNGILPDGSTLVQHTPDTDLVHEYPCGCPRGSQQ